MGQKSMFYFSMVLPKKAEVSNKSREEWTNLDLPRWIGPISTSVVVYMLISMLILFDILTTLNFNFIP